MGIQKRKIACRDISCMCLSVQLDYLNMEMCIGIKPRKDILERLDQSVHALWNPKRTDYFDPYWLQSELQFTQQLSAVFTMDKAHPTAAWTNAISNIEFNKEDSEWIDFGDKSTFYGVLVINGSGSDDFKSHAIGVRKASSDRYFLHDIYTEALTSTAVAGYDCKEYEYNTESRFEDALNQLLGLYMQQGYTDLFVIELIPVPKLGSVGPIPARYLRWKLPSVTQQD